MGIHDDVEPLVQRENVGRRIVDHRVGAQFPHQFGIPGAAHGGHMRADMPGDLHSHDADRARGAVDQNALPAVSPASSKKRKLVMPPNSSAAASS